MEQTYINDTNNLKTFWIVGAQKYTTMFHHGFKNLLDTETKAHLKLFIT